MHTNRRPLIIGHRGASAVAPENTLAAFSAAIQAGADGVEFDVRLSRDCVPVIIHDDTLRRTGGQDKFVADLSAAEMKTIDVGSWFDRKHSVAHQFASETIPTLQELFDLYQSTPGILYLEMKCAPSENVALATACGQAIRRNAFEKRVVVECFDLSAIETVRKIEPLTRTAALFEPKLSSPKLFAAQRLVDKALAAGANEIALHHQLANPRVINKARNAGLHVVVWTVDDRNWIARARSLAVDALITNDPAMMLLERERTRLD